MRVLIACEFSGVVRRAFRALGHEAWSCDILPAADNSPFHIRTDVIGLLQGLRHPDADPNCDDARPLSWDLLIAHPPCTYLCNSGVRWLYGGKGTTRDPKRWEAMEHAAGFFAYLLRQSTVQRVAVENPIMHGFARDLINAAPDQTIQPWQHGHPEIKATCLWLRGLPKLQPTKIVDGRTPRVHHESPGPDRWKRRSITYQGIAEAMAEQWGG